MDPLAERLKSLTPLQRAVVALKETQARLDALERQRSEPIAIVGMACRFPGGAVDPRSYWRLLCDGVDAIRETPPDRWDVDRFYDPDPAAPGKMCTRWGGYLDAIDKFDNHFFGISDREAAQIDPQQRLLLELTWEALEDAGLPPSLLRGTKTGAFIGISASEYGINLSGDISLTGSHAAAGTSLCLAANRLSFAFGLQGPSLALDTACSSSLVAVHLACQHIRNGECEMALAGGTNLLLTPLGTINLTKAGFCARDGRVRAFDAAAGGYVRSDGAGIVALKPLSAAVKDGDPIYAVIRGSAVNTNGASNGLTAPSRAAQEQVLREAYARAKVSPGQIQYVETQGTGTPLGDTIEALALGSVLGEGRPNGSHCAIGAVKTNIGHTEAASGIASLMKAALALKHGQLPGNLHFKNPNPQIPFDRLPLRVLQKLQPWPDGDQPRLAGVSAFGFGGSNAHAVLEEAPKALNGESTATADSGPVRLLPLSARTDAALRDLARRYINFLGDNPPPWRDVCWTAAVRREHHDCRLAILAQSAAEARDLLATFVEGSAKPSIFSGRKPFGRNPKIAFVYEGGSEVWEKYGRELIQSLPGFAAALESFENTLQSVLDWRLSPALQGGASVEGRPPAPAALVGLQLALTAWWQNAGVTPDVVLGAGVGELAAACAAGILTQEEALRMAAASEIRQNTSLKPAKLPFLSSLDGQTHDAPDLGPSHWQACRQDARNRDAAAAALARRGVDFCLSLGACADSASQPFAETLRPSLETIAQLYAGGADLKWMPLYPADARCVRLPTYPWQKQRLWVEHDKWTRCVDAASSHMEKRQDTASTESPEHRPRPDLIAPYVAPRSPLENSLAEAWSAVLGIEGIGVHDNFFELGGDSLQATILLNRLRDDLGEVLAGHVLFQVQTIAELADYIGARTTERGAGCQGAEAVPDPASEASPKNATKIAPLSFAQQRLWLLDRLDPENPAYNIPMALRLSGPIDLAVLDRAMTEVVARHETLRTSVEMIEDEPRQVISPAAPQMLPLIDLSGADCQSAWQVGNLPHADAAARAQEEARLPFRLNEGPLVRAVLLRLAATEHILVIVMHHVITDDWSMGVLFHELAALYPALSTGRPSPLPQLPTQYADYAAWQRQHLQGETLDRLLNYWRERLAGLPTLELPTDRPRPPLVSHEGAVFRGTLPVALVERVKELGRRAGATLYMSLLAAFEVLLHRYSGQDDFAVGSPIAGRVRKDTEGLVGFLANTLAMRADLAGNPTFRETLRRVRATALAAFQHQEMPFERLVEELNPPRDTSRHPLFQVLFTLQNAPWPKARLADLSISHVPLDSQTAKFDLWLSLRETDSGLQSEVEYNVALFDAATIHRMMGHFETLLEAIAADADRPIGRLPILTEPERLQFLQWNDTAKDFHNTACLHELVEDQVARSPEAVAVDFEGSRLTYAELNRAANQLARYLARYDVGADMPVVVCLERSPEMVTTLLAILKAGGAYLPLDPDYPLERLGFMIADSRPAAIVTTRALAEGLPAVEAPLIYVDEIADAVVAEDGGNLHSRTSLDDVAYVIYTSGSTGRPKGVRNTHRGITNRLLWMQDAYGLSSEDRVLQKTPYSFDVSVWEFFWPLLTGARLVLAQPGGHKDPRYLIRLIVQQQITTLHFVPSMLAVFLEDDEVGLCRSVKRVICSGEALSYELQQRFFARLPAELHNLYGPTEAAVDVTYWQCRRPAAQVPRDARIVPIGRPIANMECYILDSHQNPLPIGCPGELHLGGVGLARDYLNRPELTAEKFIPHPFSSQPGARLYRTGDLCRWLSDGNIEYLGRLDFQVKIRGFRIELGEIEAALDSHPAMRQSVVVVRGDAADPRLVAYIVPHDGHAPATEELRDYLRKLLPEFMVPGTIMSLESMPLTASGKVDRKSLPAADEQRSDLQAEYAPPRNETESRLAEIWQGVLHVPRVGIYDNFFALGGHSLLAAQVASRIARVLRAELPLRDMFQSPTIAELAERVVSALAAGRRALGPPILPTSREGELIPSFTQEALWFLDQLERGRATYTIYSPLRIQGRLNLATVEKALNEIVRRHEALRTHFPAVDGRPIAVIEPAQPKALPLVDLSRLPPLEREPRLRQAIAEEMERPIDLQNGPLIRITMYRMADDDHVAMVSAHHIIYDGLSMAVLLGELAALYTAFEAGNPSPLPELPVQYADFAAWQRQWLQGDELARLRTYWVKQLSGLSPLELPLDHPRPGIRSTRGATRFFELSPQTSAALLDFCRREGVTPFETLLAAFQVMLMRYSGQEDFAIGTPVANRDRPEIESLIGYFVNVVVLRSDLSGDPSFRDLLARLRRTTLDAYDHQAITLDQVVAAVNPPRDMSRHPLFQVMFALQNIELPQLDSFGLSMTPLEDGPSPRSSYFDLTLALWQSGEVFRGELNFSTELFAAETIDRMAGHFSTLLAEAVARPDESLSRLPLLSGEERQQLLAGWNQTAADYPRDSCVHELFAAHAKQAPEAVAVVLGDDRWTYGELNDRADRLALHLRRRGVGQETRVGICLERSPELIAAVLAVWKAGGAYVPLDPAYNHEAQTRVAYMLESAEASLVLTNAELAPLLPCDRSRIVLLDDESGENGDITHLPKRPEGCSAQMSDVPVFSAALENLAYILYTSGSTGRPKGVMVTHDNLLNAYQGWAAAYRLGAEVRVHLQMASFGFDVFAGDVLRALCSGGTLVICRKELFFEPAELVRLMRDESVDAAEFVPVVLRNLVQYLEETGQSLDFMKLVVVGSDAWYAGDHRRARAVLPPAARLVNSYGLTETTIDSSFFEGDTAELPAGAVMPIGRPFANVRFYVLDGRMQPAPIGVPGELYIGGLGVSRGYVDPALDAARFVPDPFSPAAGTRLCRTGDRARRRTDGQTEFLGRADNQIKISGFRVEPGEVEQLLAEHPLVAQAAVVGRQRSPGDVRLVACFVPVPGEAVDASELQRFLAARLPDYMVPSAYTALSSLPTTTNGKIDRKSLPEPDWSALAESREFVEPRTPAEGQLAAIWSDVLNVERVGATDNFFDLGGNSLLALRLISRVRSAFIVELPLVSLFKAPTLEGLAAEIIAIRATQGATLLPPIVARPIAGPVEASITAEGFYTLQQLMPDSPALNMPAALRLTGKLDVDALLMAIEEMVRRHAILRTAFTVADDGRLLQIVAPEMPLHIPVEDFSTVPEASRSEVVRRAGEEQALKRFDLEKGPLIRIRLLRFGETEHVVLATMHHVISDAWSMEIVAHELAALYDAFHSRQPSPLPPLPAQYTDYSVWQREYLQGEVVQHLLKYWRKKLDGLQPLRLPLDRPRMSGASAIQRVHAFRVPRRLRDRLVRVCQREQVTLYMLTLAVYKILLHRHSGAGDIAVGAPIAGRRHPETQGMIGLFMNMLVMRTDLSGNPSFRDLLGRVRETVLEALDHQDLPFGHLIADLAPEERSANEVPLVQVLFNYLQRGDSNDIQRRRDLAVRFENTDLLTAGTGEFDLVLAISDAAGELQCALSYDADRFDNQTIERMAGQLLAMLESVADPGAPGERSIDGAEIDGELLAEDPLGAPSRLCRTGDRARWRADGQIEFLGRADNQVKIRGFRIEPGEVEELLARHPSLAQAAVAARERLPGDLRLVAYVVGKEGTVPDAAELKQHLAQRVPDYMVPSAFVALECLPTTSSGKVDRKALPAPDWDSVSAHAEYVAPRPGVEEELAAIWSEVLEVPRVGALDNFFDLGGNSLLALRLVSRVRAKFAVELPLVALFVAPSVAGLAERIEALRAQGRMSHLPPIRPVPRVGPLRASFAQERYWYVQQLTGQAPTLNMHTAVSLKGKLDVAAMRTAMNLVVRRHESLRTSFVDCGGELFQIVSPEVTVVLPVVDLDSLPAEERGQSVRELSRRQAAEPFDLATAKLFRARLLRLGDTEHVLLLTMHHIIGDAWSVEIIAREVVASYLSIRAGLTAVLPDLRVQYADYAAWQRDYLQGPVLESLLTYWRGKLRSMTTLDLPVTRKRVSQPHDTATRKRVPPRVQRMESFQVPPGLKRKFSRLCHEEAATPFMLFLAAFQALLHVRSGSDDITVCVPVTERYLEETQAMVGLFVNTVALRTDLGGAPTFRDALSRVRLTVQEALDHRELPFEALISGLRADRELTRRQLERVRFRFHERTTAHEALPLGELTAEVLPDASDVTPEIFDLVLTVIDGPNGFQGHWSYDCALFDEQTIHSLTTDLQSLLESVAAEPDRPLPQLFGRDAPPAPSRAAVLETGRKQPSLDKPIDWDAECELDASIRLSAGMPAAVSPPARVLLTGATGFLGAYLLRELLQQTAADVYCLVRARSTKDGMKKIAENLSQYNLNLPDLDQRVVPVCGDLAQPLLGLSPAAFDQLAATIDAVYHNGAYVNFVYPYQMLRPANVDGTVDVLRLSAQTKVKPLHFISTVSVFDAPEYDFTGTIDENRPLEAVGTLRGGYAQSKCVAEKLVRAAAERGLPVAIYRPGRVTGDSLTGAESLADYTTLLLRLCIEINVAPSTEDRVDMTPVDYVARAVVGLARRPESRGGTFHLVNPNAVPVREVYRAIRACGYDLHEVTFDEWRRRAIDWGSQSKDESFTAFAHWLMLMGPVASPAPSASPVAAPAATTIACDRTLRALEPLGISCPAVDIDLLKKQVDFLVRKKIVPPSKPPRSEPRSLVLLRPGGSRGTRAAGRPLFLIHGLGGHVAAFMPLARAIAAGRPVYGLQAIGLDPDQTPQDRIEAMAASYLEEIQEIQPQGPYLLAGWSMGGLIALEAARQLLAAGQEAALVAMLDTYLSLKEFPRQELNEQSVLHRIAPQLNVPISELKGLPLDRQWERIAELAEKAQGIGVAEIRRLAATCTVHLSALSRYEIRPYPGAVLLFSGDRADRRRTSGGRGRLEGRWKSLFPKLRVEPAPGDHFSMLREPHVQVLAECLDRYLRACDDNVGWTSTSVSESKTDLEVHPAGKNGQNEMGPQVHPTKTRSAP